MGWIVLAFFVFVLTGLPVAFALGIVPSIFIIAGQKAPVVILPQSMFAGLDSFTLLAVPLFILAGELMVFGGISERLVQFAQLLTGRIRGGFGMSTVLASTMFGGVSGSAVADTAAIGGITIPGMAKLGYSRGFATALQAAAGPIGILIPPSISMVLYGVVTNTSIAQLFIGGIIPGLLMCVGFMIYCYVFARTRGRDSVVRTNKVSHKSATSIVLEALPALGCPVIVVAGIRYGVVTPTEGAVLAVLYALIVGMLFYRQLTLKKIVDALVATAITNAVVMWIIANCFVLGWLLTAENFPGTVKEVMTQFISNKWTLLLIINILMLIVGTFLETTASILLLAPVLMPLAASAGISSLGLGIILVTNLAIGMFTPPVGITLFVASGISGVKMREILRDLVPFVLVGVIVLAIVTYRIDHIVAFVRMLT